MRQRLALRKETLRTLRECTMQTIRGDGPGFTCDPFTVPINPITTIVNESVACWTLTTSA